MPLPSSRLHRTGRNRWNRKLGLGLLGSGALGLALLGGGAYDSLTAAGRARLASDEEAAASTARPRAAVRRGSVSEELIDSLGEPSRSTRTSNRIRPVSAEEFTDEFAEQDASADRLETEMSTKRRAIPAALNLPANHRNRVRPVQYNEAGYVPELPEDAVENTAAEEEGLETQIRPAEEVNPTVTEAELPPEMAEEPLEENLPAVEPEPAIEEPVPALETELEEATPEPAAEVRPVLSQYSEEEPMALAQEGLQLQQEGTAPADPKVLTPAEICRKYHPKPISALGIGIKPTKPGALPSGKEDPAAFCFPSEKQTVGEFGWYDDCPYGNYLFICHGPLYFEEVDAERYGETWGSWLQPAKTTGQFFGTVPMVPYKWFANTFSEECYGYDKYGQARNGFAEGKFIPPFHAGAAAFTGGLVTGLFFLIP